MNKVKTIISWVILGCLIFILGGCHSENKQPPLTENEIASQDHFENIEQKVQDEENSDDLDEPNEDSNLEIEDEPSIKISIKDVEDKDVPLLIAKRLKEMNDFEAHTLGKTVAKLLITYNQEIDSTLSYHDGIYYLHTFSKSLLVKLYHEAFIKEDSVIYRTKANDEFSTLTAFDYLSLYGNNPFSLNIEGFIIKEGSVTKVLNLSHDDEYIYQITLDGNLCGEYNKIQMKEYGGLSDYPTYEQVVLTIHILEDFTPTMLEFEASYNAPYPVFGNAKCKQTYTVTFSKISNDIKEIIEKQK